jgi:hypothetical protein
LKLVVDDKLFIKQMNNLVQYGLGFVEGAQIGKQQLLKQLGPEVRTLLEQYIDANARMNPDALHHVYEWYQTGSPTGRLFEIEYIVTGLGLSFQSTFRQSTSVKNGSNVPFYNKAKIMEAGVSVTIKPKSSDVLAFEDNGETVFTKKPVTVPNPGGTDTTGAYNEVFKEFFYRYLSQSFLDVTGLRRHLGTPLAFKNNLAAGISGGRPVGVRVGRQWVASKESVI